MAEIRCLPRLRERSEQHPVRRDVPPHRADVGQLCRRTLTTLTVLLRVTCLPGNRKGSGELETENATDSTFKPRQRMGQATGELQSRRGQDAGPASGSAALTPAQRHLRKMVLDSVTSSLLRRSYALRRQDGNTWVVCGRRAWNGTATAVGSATCPEQGSAAPSSITAF